MGEVGISKDISRRSFIVRLVATGLAISGWILMPEALRRITNPILHDYGLELRDDLVVKYVKDGAEIKVVDELGEQRAICKVNEIGRMVLDCMDGRSSIHDIIKNLSSRLEIPKSDADTFSTNVVLFVAQLSEIGLLKRKFFANIYAREIVA